MRLLILGGTLFLGRHLAEQALARGWDVTLFHRGNTNPDLFPEAAHVFGDRKTAEGLALLTGNWDAVVDTCGYVPRVVQMSVEALTGRVGRYCFISTVSVYPSLPQPGMDETATLATLEDPTTEEVTGATYGGLKVLCEQAAGGESALNIRPGLIVGPHDPTDRFTYWVHRVAQGGRVLCPGTPALPVQFVDGRDLAAFTLDAVAADLTGAYNVAGNPTTLGEVVGACQSAAGSDAEFVWKPEEWLIEQGVQPWSQLPLWVPTTAPKNAGFSRISDAKAIAAGLTYRPLWETVRDTLAWDQARQPSENAYKNCLTATREAELLG